MIRWWRGAFFDTADGAVDAGDNAEVVKGNDVDEVGRNRRVVPTGSTIDNP